MLWWSSLVIKRSSTHISMNVNLTFIALVKRE